jgi:hypothetical protein
MIQIKKPEIDQKLIGVIFLAVGIIALFTVAGIAVNKFTGTRTFEDEAGIDENSKAVQQQQSEDQKISNRVKNKKPSNINEADIVGAWEALFRNHRALIQLKGGYYRLILISNNNTRSRQYSNGRYQIQGNVLILKPDLSIPAPKSKGDIQYRLFTRTDMPMMVGMYKGKQIWQEVDRADIDMYIPNYHPVIGLSKDKVVVWSVLK